MKIELKKVNKADGTFWYGIWINDNCQIPGYGEDLVSAQEAYDKMIAYAKAPKPEYETIKSDDI